ncbi:hypothetical protein POTOM_032940 [Populus tomentosa]|uniref:Uncharacterized protein n=1 Tax=Populus tomentosa TaxID=118781 RepID=A0A8X8CQ78_POPTO|nr:hypothetical protein POTOM_032940 [Populus tomentosa]
MRLNGLRARNLWRKRKRQGSSNVKGSLLDPPFFQHSPDLSLEARVYLVQRAPTSPTKGTSTDATYDLESEPTTPKIYEDANPSMDDFEFGNSRRFNIDDIHSGDSMRFDDAMKDQRKHRRQHKESFPTTAFADYFVMETMPKKVESLVREKADAEDEKLSSREFIYEQK